MVLIHQIRNRYLFLLDVVLLIAAVYLSYILRLETFKLGQLWSGFVFYSVLAVIIIPLIFYVFGIYSRYWVYASVEEMTLLATAVAIGAAIAGGVGLIVLRTLPVGTLSLPRSIPFIFFPIALCVTAGPRFAMRIYAQYARRRSDRLGPRAATAQTVLIMGAGEAGMLIVRELQRSPSLNMEVVGFVDDDPRKRATRILGVPVLGNRRAIPQLASTYRVDLVVIAMPTTSGKDIREIVQICERAGVKTKIMPGIYEVLDGTVSVNQLRNVQIEDLLRREPVNIDDVAVRALLGGKRVMVTGGGGSIGSELCRQILRCQPSELIVLGHGENSIFEICNELQRQLRLEMPQLDDGELPPAIRPVIADIRFAPRVEAIFQQYRPQVVFHAAAHKHVPLMEENPTEAISNNVFGTRNLLAAAAAVDAERFVMISTDKAVKPTSIMGASKRLAELLVHQTAQQLKKPYVAVRFGNVLGSRGSVVLTFKQQIAAGGPVTVTHPDMKRFFMTIPEAVQLVLQAAVLGQGGEVFMLDMGEPVKIVDLAQDLIALSGLEVGRDIDIVFSGMRPGEKLYEELFIPGEVYQRTAHQKIFVIGNANDFVPARIDRVVASLEKAVAQDNTRLLIDTVIDLLPRYRPWSDTDTDQQPATVLLVPQSEPAPSGLP